MRTQSARRHLLSAKTWTHDFALGLLLLPTVVLLLLLSLFPMFYSLWLSFNEWNLGDRTATWHFVGLRNFVSIFTTHLFFWSAVRVTLVFVGATVIIETLLGLGIALLLNDEFRGRGMVRTIIVFPLMIFENLSFRGLATVGVGNSLDNVMSGARSLEGLGGNDILNGDGRLDGGAGDDLLQGRAGLSFFNDDSGQLEYLANTFVFRPGDGRDTIQENDAFFNSAYYQNEDRVVFADGIAPSDIIWKRAGNDLVLHVVAETDQITVPSFYDLRLDRGGYLLTGAYGPPEGSVFTPRGGFSTYVAPSRVELVEFADGTVWTADRFGAPLLGDLRAHTCLADNDCYSILTKKRG